MQSKRFLQRKLYGSNAASYGIICSHILEILLLIPEFMKIKQENLLLKIDTLTLHSDKERLLRDIRKAADEKEQIQAKKEGLLEDIGVLDKEFDPEVASWQTSKGEVVPVYEDCNGRGMDFIKQQS